MASFIRVSLSSALVLVAFSACNHDQFFFGQKSDLVGGERAPASDEGFSASPAYDGPIPRDQGSSPERSDSATPPGAGSTDVPGGSTSPGGTADSSGDGIFVLVDYAEIFLQRPRSDAGGIERQMVARDLGRINLLD